MLDCCSFSSPFSGISIVIDLHVVRSLLWEVVRVKMDMYDSSKSRSQPPEEYLRSFLDAEIKPLWPQGWMQTR